MLVITVHDPKDMVKLVSCWDGRTLKEKLVSSPDAGLTLFFRSHDLLLNSWNAI